MESTLDLFNTLIHLKNNYYCDAEELKLKTKIFKKSKKEDKKSFVGLEQGGRYELDEFQNGMGAWSFSSGPNKKFLKETRLNEVELEILKDTLNDGIYDPNDKYEAKDRSQWFYNHFNKMATPRNFQKMELQIIQEDVESSNIYDKMCARQKTQYRTSFDIWIDGKTVTIFREFWKNTTFSQSEVRGFM